MAEPPKGEQLRKHTRHAIYTHLYQSGMFCSKQTLARQLHLSLPTVYQHLTQMMEEGLVEYSGQQQSTGGRRAMGLRINPKARFGVGVSITASRLRLVASDLRLGELAYQKVARPEGQSWEELAPWLAEVLEKFLDDFGLDRAKLLGVGVAIPATMDPATQRIVLAPTLGMRDKDLSQLTRSIPYPTCVENDATCAGYAEWFTHWQGKDLAYLLVETGVGGAIVLHQALHRGDHCRAGEFGHMCVEPGGLSCTCGKQGCLEAYCSPRRITQGLGISVTQFFQGLKEHNPDYETLWHDMLRHMAMGLTNIRMALDCEVVIGGFLSEFLPPYLETLRGYIAAGDPFSGGAGWVHLSRLSHHAVPLGACLHFVREFLDGV